MKQSVINWSFRLALLMAALIGITIISLVLTRPASSSVYYSAVSLDFDENGLCPGDMVRYALVIEIDRPTSVDFRSVIYRGLQAEGDIVSGTSMVLGFPVPEPYRREDSDAGFVVPALPPGDYSRVIGIADATRPVRPSFAVIPFRVRKDCQ